MSKLRFEPWDFRTLCDCECPAAGHFDVCAASYAAKHANARLEAMLAEHRALGRKLAQLLLDGSRGTADVSETCRVCNGLGTVHVDGGAAPCSCAAGQTFRNALAAQERKRQAGTAPAARFLPNDANPVASGRDRAAGREE